MTFVTLAYSDMALWSDPDGTRVQFPRLTGAAPTETPEGVAVRFYGDELGTPFGGEGLARALPIAARYFKREQQLLADMLALFRTAHHAPDRRLLFRTNLADIAGLDPLSAVTVDSWTPTPLGAGHFDLTFNVTAVNFTVEV